jgi:WD40 repeat protein
VDNKIFVRNITQKNKSSISLEIKEENKISELSWYTLDENYKYLLVGTHDGYSFLLDVNQMVIIMKFEKFGSGVVSLIWKKQDPGTFISITGGSGRVAYWNVSKKNYNEITKFADCEILNCLDLQDQSKVLMSLGNGSVVIYDLEFRKNIFTLEPNHSETIFDLKYNPFSYGIFATCSYDSTIKVWDITENKIICNFNVEFIAVNTEKKQTPDKIHIYTLTWSPTDKNSLLSGDSLGNVRMWDISKQKLVASCKVNSFSESSIVGMDWEYSGEILATSIDTIYFLKYEAGKLNLTRNVKINSNLFQIKFNPFDTKEFAVACMDNSIKFFKEGGDKPYKVMNGHTMKVFGLAFNKKRKGLLASSSEDFSVGVWNLESNTNMFFKGHKNNTRHLVWLADQTNILASGSWDGTIRIWNVDTASCICEITEHYSDVYGIDVSPHHPYLLTSCSRDNSIRYWNLLLSQEKIIENVLLFEYENSSKRELTNENKLLEQKLNSVKDDISRADFISNNFFVIFNLI